MFECVKEYKSEFAFELSEALEKKLSTKRDIKEKLSDSIVITPNIFIGTIHSFLMHYFIMPHADSLGYNVTNVLVVDKLSMKGFEWIDSWVERSNPEKDKKEKQDIKSRLMQSRRNSAIEAAAKKGIYTYDGIIKEL